MLALKVLLFMEDAPVDFCVAKYFHMVASILQPFFVGLHFCKAAFHAVVLVWTWTCGWQVESCIR